MGRQLAPGTGREEIALKPGEKVSLEEGERIEALSELEKKQEIEEIVEESGASEDEAKKLAVLLSLFYRRPDRYQRMPGTDDLHMVSRPLPFKGE